MYCPKCREEYREGFRVCQTCNEELVEQLVPISDIKLPKHPLIIMLDNSIEKCLKYGSIIYVLIGIIYELFYFWQNRSSNLSKFTAIFLCQHLVTTILWGLFFYGLGRIIEILREGLKQ